MDTTLSALGVGRSGRAALWHLGLACAAGGAVLAALTIAAPCAADASATADRKHAAPPKEAAARKRKAKATPPDPRLVSPAAIGQDSLGMAAPGMMGGQEYWPPHLRGNWNTNQTGRIGMDDKVRNLQQQIQMEMQAQMEAQLTEKMEHMEAAKQLRLIEQKAI